MRVRAFCLLGNEACRDVPLKASDPYLRFCFITGITKFSQLSIFSTINNLKNVSMRPDFSAICGFTEEEVKTIFKEDIEDMAVKYECTMYLIFSMLNVYVRTQVKCTGGKTDMVVWMPDTTYVFELKVNGTAQDALEQIDSKNYALPFHTEGRKVIKAGIHFNKDTRTIDEWVTDQP